MENYLEYQQIQFHRMQIVTFGSHFDQNRRSTVAVSHPKETLEKKNKSSGLTAVFFQVGLSRPGELW